MRKLTQFLAILLLISVLAVPCAAQAEELRIYRIDTADEFLELAQQCRLDSFSKNLRVILAADIDLSSVEFDGIPVFSGEFEGRGHTIRGVKLQHAGSVVGLFRYLTQTAVVEDLHVQGIISPGGSSSNVGAIAGSNAGTILGCSFSGIVSGSENIGGIVGVNTLTGLIHDCRTEGTVYGNHFIGGIAGVNHGTIRDCINNAQANTVLEQNSIKLEDITMDAIAGTEYAASVTDIGGIAGVNFGVLRKCTNTANISYPKVGFNIGGIAGRSSGYVTGCVNHGNVQGRKDIGGIVGQLEPAVNMLFETDTLQILQEQINTMSALASNTASHVENTSEEFRDYLGVLDNQIDNVQDALALLLPDPDAPELPDPDSMQAAQNVISGSFSAMSETLNLMGNLAHNASGVLTQDLNALSGQMGTIGATLNDAGNHLGGSIQDVSDMDNEDDTTAKLHANRNEAPVSGDWNVGGICGTVGPENDLDPESDVLVVGDLSANFDLSLRAVIVGCQNTGTICASKQYAGGIAGLATMGLVRNCVNRGNIEAASADYVGGIAGKSQGYIRFSSVRSYITADCYAGGIAGQAVTVSDCHSFVRLTGTEYTGFVLGHADDLMQLTNNYYLAVGKDIGAIDGISYVDHAQGLDSLSFFELPNIPSDFRRLSIVFRFEDGSSQVVALPYGFTLNPIKIPALPSKAAHEAHWAGEEMLTAPLYFDCEFTAVYTPHRQVLPSDLRNAIGQPRMLALGQFPSGQAFILQMIESDNALCAWRISLPESHTPVTLRLLPPEEAAGKDFALQLQQAGIWKDADFTTEGSYLVFESIPEMQAVRLIVAPQTFEDFLPLIGILFAVLLFVVLILIWRKKKSS